MKYISEQGLIELKNWNYKSSEYTPLDNAMQPFWNGFVKLFPLVSDAWLSSDMILVDGTQSYHSDRHTDDDLRSNGMGFA